MARMADDVAKSPSRGTLKRARTMAVALASAPFVIAWSGSALAQGVPPPASYTAIDENGVNIVTGELFTAAPAISVGQPGMGGLAYQRTHSSDAQGWRDNVTGTINAEGNTYTVTLMGASEVFTEDSGSFTPEEGAGGTLTLSAGVYTYTTASGAVASYDADLASELPTQADVARITSFASPSGEALTFTYTELSGTGFLAHRLQSVTNNLGYQLSFEYENNDADESGINLLEVTAINNAIAYCSPTANGCGLSGWPTLAFGVDGSADTVTDALSRTTRYAITSGRITGIRWPGSGSDNVTISYSGDNVYQVSNGVGTWTYSEWGSGAARTDPLSHTQAFQVSGGRLTGWTQPGGPYTTYSYDSAGRLTRITQPEGNYTRFSYDDRGNVTEVREVAKSGPGPSDIVMMADYPEACDDPGITQVTCNLPISTTDARGFRTDYTYDATHGGVLTVTSPASEGSAPVGSGTRPQTRYAYTQLYAYYKDGGGLIAQAPGAVFRLTSVSACATSASCSGGADETLTTIGYGSNGVANNRLPLTVSSGAGDPSVNLTATSTFAYDDVGNLLRTNGPLSGDADTRRARYDALRRTVGIIGPDPDSGGSLEHRALRYTYNTLGVVTSVERGNVDSLDSDTDWENFTTLEQLNFGYDAIGRRTQSSLVAGGGALAVTQYSYDNANRLDCVTVRMNTAEFASLPASACTLDTEGSVGPDRITRYTYNVADRLTQVTNGYGTSVQQNTVTQTWSNNGRIATVVDANGNLTTYEHDGFDRLRKIRFPNASGGGSSTTNYEQYTYDATSNVTEVRRRDAAEVEVTYDNLNRVALMNAPLGSHDVGYAYDLFGRVIEAATGTIDAGGDLDPSHELAFAYDQLSRQTGATGPLGTVAYQYDLAGNRTRVTWPGASFFAQYDYDAIGEVTAIRENGATSGVGVLASYAYDNLGRRTSISRGNGVVTTFAYDNAGLLAELEQDLAGSSHDQTLSFTSNPAGQALTRANSDSDYMWSQPSPGVTSYTANGLNQLTAVGGVSQAYDGRGNLTTGGYSYDVYNRLVGASGATLAYDPAGRLYETAGGVTTRFLYDSTDMIAEYNNSGTLLRRYVHGPGFDQPIVWYEGADTSDRHWLTTDRLGSVTAITDDDGAMVSINTYDEYGVPGPSNAGRFQYTGQAWLSEAGVYHYKARAYDPELGRFLQTDPILHAGGMNLYAYVENDPLNWVDPLGLLTQCWVLPPQPDGSIGAACRKIDGLAIIYGRDDRGVPPRTGDGGGDVAGGGIAEPEEPAKCEALREQLANLYKTLYGRSGAARQNRIIGGSQSIVDTIMGGATVVEAGNAATGSGPVRARAGRLTRSTIFSMAGEAYQGLYMGQASSIFSDMQSSLEQSLVDKDREMTEAGCSS